MLKDRSSAGILANTCYLQFYAVVGVFYDSCADAAPTIHRSSALVFFTRALFL